MIIPRSALTARNLLYVAIAFCAIYLTVSLYYAMTLWSMVNRRLDGEVFKHSARIYAAAPES